MGLKVFLIICIKDFLGKRTRAYITDVIVILTPIGYSTFGEDARSVGTIVCWLVLSKFRKEFHLIFKCALMW